jgi:hypothetical protein
VFGRRNRQEEAAREADRRALFAELAKRPDTICPFLGMAEARTAYHDGVSEEHRCYAFGDPAELSAEQQTKVCTQRGYGNCPRYLRGVLVIPTEELEALRHPQSEAPPPAPVPAAQRGGGRRGLVAVVLVLLLAIGGGGAAFALLQGNGVAVAPTPTPTTTVEPSPSAVATPTVAATAEPTPYPVTPSPDPTPLPEDVFIGYDVTVLADDYVIFRIDEEGNIVGSLGATYDGFSRAPVDEVTAPNGLHYWVTTDGDYTGLSYIKGQSGPFLIRKVFEGADGTLRYEVLPESRL